MRVLSFIAVWVLLCWCWSSEQLVTASTPSTVTVDPAQGPVLAGVDLSLGLLKPLFSPSILQYQLLIAEAVTSTSVRIKLNDSSATAITTWGLVNTHQAVYRLVDSSTRLLTPTRSAVEGAAVYEQVTLTSLPDDYATLYVELKTAEGGAACRYEFSIERLTTTAGAPVGVQSIELHPLFGSLTRSFNPSIASYGLTLSNKGSTAITHDSLRLNVTAVAVDRLRSVAQWVQCTSSTQLQHCTSCASVGCADCHPCIVRTLPAVNVEVTKPSQAPVSKSSTSSRIRTSTQHVSFDLTVVAKALEANNSLVGMDQGQVFAYLGCYNDEQFPNRAFPVILSNQVTSVDDCESLAQAQGYNTFALQYYGQCWAGNNPPYDEYGQTSDCPQLGGALTNQVYQLATPIWSYLGCYNDEQTPNRAFPALLSTQVNSVADCESLASAQGQGYDTVGLQYYGQCWAGTNPPYAEYGAASDCPQLGGAFTNQVYQLQVWTYLGCYNDQQARAFPALLATQVNTVADCESLAQAQGYNTFALQYYGQCWAGTNPPYDEYGSASSCPQLGGAYTNQVYQLTYNGGVSVTSSMNQTTPPYPSALLIALADSKAGHSVQRFAISLQQSNRK